VAEPEQPDTVAIQSVNRGDVGANRSRVEKTFDDGDLASFVNPENVVGGERERRVVELSDETANRGQFPARLRRGQPRTPGRARPLPTAIAMATQPTPPRFNLSEIGV
jgi:hypothetical protein